MMQFDNLDAYWQDIRNIPSLTAEQEFALAEKIQHGDDRALDRLVTGNLRYIVSVARQYAEKAVSLASANAPSMDDLISEGNIALMMAARKWKPKEEGDRFVSYAVHDIRKAMEQALATEAPMMTLPKSDKTLGADLRRMSADAPVHPGQTNTLGDMLKAGKPMTDDEVQNNELSYSLSVAMQHLNDREKDIIRLYYGVGPVNANTSNGSGKTSGDEHLTMAEIAEKKGMKRERVRQIRKTAERKMRRFLRHNSIDRF